MRWRDRILGWLRLRPRIRTRPAGPVRGRVDHVVILDGTMSSLDNGDATNAGQLYMLLGETAPHHRLNLRYEAGIQWDSWRNSLDVIEGRGINRQIRRVYGHIASRYRPGDRIFLFGYSRGAYAVRSLAGLIDRVGLLRADCATERNVRLAYRYYRNGGETPMQALFRRKRCHPRVEIEMVGVWDTVKALGLRLPVIWKWSERAHQFHSDALGAHILRGFQALAMDETRVAFAPVLWRSTNGYSGQVEQVWFRGTHGDVGGQLSGFEAARPLANIPLVWMLEKAESCGLPLPEGWRGRLPCDPEAPSVGTTRGWGKVFVLRARRVIGTDPSESIHPSAHPGTAPLSSSSCPKYLGGSGGQRPPPDRIAPRSDPAPDAVPGGLPPPPVPGSVAAMKWIDMPPVWLAAALVLARLAGLAVPAPAFGDWAELAGPLLVLAGLALMAAAAAHFLRAKTTIVPHEVPRSLIATGIYRFSRNPIYLGDVLILAGAVLYWRAALPLVLVPLFAWILRVRFILPEEARLGDAFPAAFESYRARTRRWL